MHRRLGPVIACVMVLGVLTGNSAAAVDNPTPPRLVTITIPAAAGDIPAKWLDYPSPPRANVLLPAGYDAHKRYPLLVLLNGLATDYAWWAEAGFVPLFRRLDAIVVMPEGGNGWYTDWWNNGERGSPKWQSYELDTVLPTILARYPIKPQRRYHAVAGTSMGGFGAVYLGGSLPGFFGSVASLSGFVDPQNLPQFVQAPLGPPTGFYFQGHNPTVLSTNLKQTRVFLSTGTGVPNGTPAAPVDPIGDAEEMVIYGMNKIYSQALVAAGVNATYQVHPGGHDIPAFMGEVKAMLAWGLFKPVVTAPTSWVNQTVATRGELWGVSYRFADPPARIVTFRRSGATLSVSAAGSAVTLSTSAGCVIHTSTPATLRLPNRDAEGSWQSEGVGRWTYCTRRSGRGGRPPGPLPAPPRAGRVRRAGRAVPHALSRRPS